MRFWRNVKGSSSSKKERPKPEIRKYKQGKNLTGKAKYLINTVNRHLKSYYGGQKIKALP